MQLSRMVARVGKRRAETSELHAAATSRIAATLRFLQSQRAQSTSSLDQHLLDRLRNVPATVAEGRLGHTSRVSASRPWPARHGRARCHTPAHQATG